MQLGEAIARRGIRKRYYLRRAVTCCYETRKSSTLEAARPDYHVPRARSDDEEGLKRYRKRVTLSKNFEALEFARSLDISVAVNIIADPAWDRERFKVLHDWCLEIPEVVNISINPPYPGRKRGTPNRAASLRATIGCSTSSTPCCQPGCHFRLYKELVETQRVLPASISAGRRCATAHASLSDSCFADRPILSECFGNWTAFMTRNSNSPITVNL